MYEWRPAESAATLYGSCIRRARLAVANGGQIAGVLFFQGESDALDPVTSAAKHPDPAGWPIAFTQLVSALRANLGNPNLPVVFAQLGNTTDNATFPNWQAVKTAQATVSIPGVSKIETADLELKDYVHFTTDSYNIIGHRLAIAYKYL